MRLEQEAQEEERRIFEISELGIAPVRNLRPRWSNPSRTGNLSMLASSHGRTDDSTRDNDSDWEFEDEYRIF
jgi:hypothetical protein